jgi:hypothetical protein
VIRSLRLISLHKVSSRCGPLGLVCPVVAILCAICLHSALAAPPPQVKISMQATPPKATVGDPISIRLDMLFPKGFQVILPKLGDRVGDFSLLEFPVGKVLTGAQSSDPTLAQYQAQIVVALFKPGEFEFPPLQMILRGADAHEIPISSPSVKISIQSVLTAQDQNLKALKKQAEIQEPVRWIMWLSIVCLILILAAIAIWFWQRRRRPQPQHATQPYMDPIALAESDLRDLLGRGLLESGFAKQFYVSLSDIVKRILEAGFRIHTLEKTSSEILKELTADWDKAGPVQTLNTIESVLTECDLVKFAKYIPSRPESNAAIDGAFEILALVKKLRQSAAAEETAPVPGVS